MKINFAKNEIQMSEKEQKAAAFVGSATYNKLQMVRRDYPDFTVKVIEKRVVKGASFEQITAYVDAVGTPKQKETFAYLTGNNPRKEKAPFFKILAWFNEQFPGFYTIFDVLNKATKTSEADASATETVEADASVADTADAECEPYNLVGMNDIAPLGAATNF